MSDTSVAVEPRRRAPKRTFNPDHAHLEKIGLRTVERAAEIEGVTPNTVLGRGLPIIRRGRRRFIKIADHDAWLRGEPLPSRKSARVRGDEQ